MTTSIPAIPPDSENSADGSTLARGALAGVLGRGLGFGTQYLFLAAVGRNLGAERAAGFYSLLAAATALAVIGRAGLDRFGLREIAAHRATGHGGIVRPLIVRLLVLQLGWFAILATAAVTFRSPLAEILNLGNDSSVVYLVAVAMGLVATFSLAEYVLAFRAVLASTIVKSILPYGIAAALVFGALLTDTLLLSRQVITALLVGMIAAAIVGTTFLWSRTAGLGNEDCPLPRLELTRAVSLAAVPLLMLGMTGLDVVILQAVDPGAQTSFYQAAQRTSMTLALGILGVNAIAGPMIAAAFASGHDAELGHVVRRASRWSLVQAAAIAVPLIVAGAWVLRLFGDEFAAAYPMLLILVAAQLINAAAGPVLQLCIMTGHERAAFATLLPIVVVAIPSYYLAGEHLGGMGIAIVTALAIATWNGRLIVLARRRFGIWSFADNWPATSVAILLASAIAAFTTQGQLTLWGMTFVGACAVGLWNFCLPIEDRLLLRKAASGGRHQTP